MYNDYFGFREKPFSVTPDPRFFYTNPHYQAAYANLVYAIHERRGFVVLTGEIGTGKTTLLRRLMENIEPSIPVIFFYNTTLGFEDLLDCICRDLGLKVQGKGHLQKIQALNQFLIEQLGKGGTVVLLIDEAQNLGEEVLENLRLLSNLETSSEKLLQIALVGQPELETKLDRPGLRQLKQRIALHCRLSRLDEEEVGPFINYRLSAVGYKRHQLFTPDAVQEIAFYSKGFPRLINILCDNALLISYATSKKRVTADIIREAASDLRLVIPEEGELTGGHTASAHKDPDVQKTRRHMRSKASFPRSHSRWHLSIGIRMLAPVLIFILVGAGLYAWAYNLSPIESLKEGFGSLHHIVQNTIYRLISEAENRQGTSNFVHSPSPGMMTEGSIKNASPPSTPDLSMLNNRIEGPQTFDQAQLVGRDPNLLAEETRTNRPRSSATQSDGVTWKQDPMAIPPGSTIAEIAASTYGTNKILGLDLIKEFNTHIENLNRVVAGQKLWLPPLTRETLVRQQPDGSYHLILGSFRGLSQADQIAQLARLKGYNTVISPRRLADNLMVYRAEIGGLGGLTAVDEAWETALTARWITLSSNLSRSRERF
jgi:general secretion pathway protein A